MSHHCSRLVFSIVLLTTGALTGASAAAASCENLATLNLPNTTITSATSVPAGLFLPPDGNGPVTVPAFCRVQGVATPTSDSVIKFEVWMPSAGWNGKLDGAGNGGYGRGFNVPGDFMVPALNRGYAVAGTDMGHPRTVGYDASWAFHHPEKLIDWASRANHLTASNAKTIIQAFYGRGPRLSYFTGCSDGGHEALMEAQRFPADYNGIIGGASANNWTRLSPAHIWEALAIVDSALPASKMPLIAQAAVAACDALDGVVDGIIDDPRRCNFDPKALQCNGPDAPTCLTAAQVGAVDRIYAGPRNPRTGELIHPGLERGSEANWTFTVTPTLGGIGTDFYRYLVFEDPSWDLRTLDFDDDVTFGDMKMGPIINSTDPDLSDFRALGGKFLMYHGWADQAVNPRNSVNYYESVVRTIAGGHGRKIGDVARGHAKHEVDEFFRLFMVPAMPHCLGGPGVDSFDALSALEQWVEHGIAPDRIVGSHTGAGLGPNIMTPVTGSFTRPLCPYPQVAIYTGHGSTNDAASFVCGVRHGEDRDARNDHGSEQDDQ